MLANWYPIPVHSPITSRIKTQAANSAFIGSFIPPPLVGYNACLIHTDTAGDSHWYYILTVAIVTATSILDWMGIMALIPVDLSGDWMQVQIHFFLADTAIN